MGCELDLRANWRPRPFVIIQPLIFFVFYGGHGVVEKATSQRPSGALSNGLRKES